MLVLIDNYDSFTYNLVQVIGALPDAPPIRVYRNDQVTVAQLEAEHPTHVMISPGPCTPREAGISNDVLRYFVGRVPVLGVCLGHQCLAYTFGGEVVRARRLVHGKTSLIRHDGSPLFVGMSNPFAATRYHSLIIAPEGVPTDYRVTATCDDDAGEIMAIQHRTLPVFGVQFHPESFLTLEGPTLLANFLAIR